MKLSAICIGALPSLLTMPFSAQMPTPLNPLIVLSSTFKCPGLPQPRLSGSLLRGPLPVTSDRPNDQLRSLAVRITTSGDPLSGTNDDVWLDIGPKAWKIGDDFDTGSTTTTVVDISGKDDNVDIPTVVPLYVRDISKLRLEKKGLCGLTDAPDSVASSIIPGIPTPASTIAALKQQVALAQYALDQQKSLLDIQQKLLQQQLDVIASAQQTLGSAVDEIANIPGQIANIQNQITNVQKQILQTPAQVASQVCHNPSIVLSLLSGGTSALVCATVQAANPVWQSLTNTATNLSQSKDRLAAELAAATARKATALQSLATATAAKAIIETQKQQDQLQYAAAHQTLDGAQNALAEAEVLAAKLPFSNFSVPIPGQWKIQHVTLIVNGHDFASFDVNDTLRQRHAEWSKSIGTSDPSEEFVRGLRVNVNKQSTHSDERVARVTTVFKVSDISGWKSGPISTARVIGTLRNPPSPGDDGYVSLDLEVETVEANNLAFVLDDHSGIGHQRFIRIEYKNRDSKGVVDTRYRNWPVGTRFAIDAPVAWDTDRQGFFELHPDSASQVVTLARGDSGRTSTVVLWWRRVTSSF